MLTDLTDSELVELNKAFHNAINVNPEATLSALQAISPAKKTVEPEQAIEPVDILRSIFAGEDIVIKASDGKKTLYDAKDEFPYRDDNFKNWKLNNKGQATPDTPVKIYEMETDATFNQMFNFLNSDFDKLVLTQNQIRDFVKDHRSKLREDTYSTFFLFKENNKYFVADVHFGSSAKLRVYVHKLKYAFIWPADDRHCLVAPQLQAA